MTTASVPDSQSLDPARLLPHFDPAEESVVGALLIDGSQVDAIAKLVSAPDFYRLRTRRLYQAILRVHEAGEHVNHVSVSWKLHEAGHLEDVGMAFIRHLAHEVVTTLPVFVESSARIVQLNGAKRRLAEASAQAFAQATS